MNCPLNNTVGHPYANGMLKDMKKALLALACMLLPLGASAAGFAKESLFLSKSSVTEGDTVRIHAIISNDSVASFKGTLDFRDEDGAIGSVSVSLSAGEATALATSWKPTAGKHTVVAELKDTAGKKVEEQSAAFTVAAKPAPVANTTSTASQPAAVTSSENIQNALANVSPATAKTAQPVFTTIDWARTEAAKRLDEGINWSEKQIATAKLKPGVVLSAETSKTSSTTPTKGWQNTAVLAGGTIALYILTILRAIVGNAAFFYPILAILFFYSLWRLIQRYRRPSWQR